MNVLVLTPDRVGSTLLQRLITVYMAAHEYDKPVINIHELTRGLEIFWNETYQRRIIGKPADRRWGYYQSLEEIVSMLEEADHYKTCRLAEYHLVERADGHADRVQLYNYLNDNFYIISARRKNLFEHALSWGIYLFSRRLNVYTHEEKVNTFYHLHRGGITIDPESMIKYLDRYRDYLKWCDHFHINSYFNYEEDLPNIEKYILGLDIFPNTQKKTWKDIFDIEWQDWNQCHRLISDLGCVAPSVLPYIGEDRPIEHWPVAKVQKFLPVADQQFLLNNKDRYVDCYNGIDQLVKNGTLVTGIPIKLQTLAEKQRVIKNLDQCIDVYNRWVDANGLGDHYTRDDLKSIANTETKFWYNQVPKHLLLD